MSWPESTKMTGSLVSSCFGSYEGFWGSEFYYYYFCFSLSKLNIFTFPPSTIFPAFSIADATLSDTDVKFSGLRLMVVGSILGVLGFIDGAGAGAGAGAGSGFGAGSGADSAGGWGAGAGAGVGFSTGTGSITGVTSEVWLAGGSF